MKTKVRHSFPQFDVFQSAVDKALEFSEEPFPFDTNDHTVLYKAMRDWLGSPPQDTADDQVTDIAGKLGEIAKEATFAHLLTGSPIEPYFAVAHTLRDALRQETSVPDISATDSRWVGAIRVALAFSSTWVQQLGHLHRLDPRDVTLAHAVRYFTKRQVAVVMNGIRASIESRPNAAAATGCILSPMSSLGDTLTMQMVDGMLEPRFVAPIGRLRLHPMTDMMGSKMDRHLPCGLIYRLAIKMLGRRKAGITKKSISDDVFQAATHFAALYDVEPFTTYEIMFPPKPGKVLEVLINITTYDELFTIPQCHPVVIFRFLDVLFSRVQAPEATSELQWSIEDAKKFWMLLLECSAHPVRSTFVNQSQFKAMLASRVGVVACEGLLRSFVINKPNTNYEFPSDAHHADTRECVIAYASDGRYWLPGRLMMGPAFYERLFATRVAHSSTMSGGIGRAFESYLAERMTELGISFRRGNLRGKTKDAIAGDADLVIETDEVIGLFELKKKGLRRETQAGNALQLAIDLAQGLIHGVNQLSKHEINLLKDGKLGFEDGSELHLNGRRIIKGVISLADYGGLHDSATVRNTLSSFAGVSVNTILTLTEAQKDALEDANKKFRILGERHTAFEEVRNDKTGRDLFDNVVFHNIFFVEFLLATTNTAEQFLKALLTNSRLTNGSRDPFFEHAQYFSLQMESQAQSGVVVAM